MYIIVVGGGKVGFHLVRVLLNAGHEVSVVEKDARKVQDLIDTFGHIALRGDGTEPSVLEEAGASRADVLIATTGSDEENLMACQLAKHHFQVKRSVALLHNPENESLFTVLGIDITLNLTEAILELIEEELPAHPALEVMPIRGDRQVVRVEVPPEAVVVGKALKEVDLPEGTRLVALISREGVFKEASPSTTLEAYDEVVFLCAAEDAEAVLETLTREE